MRRRIGVHRGERDAAGLGDMAGDAGHEEDAAEEMDDDVALAGAARARRRRARRSIVEQSAITSQKTKTVMRSPAKTTPSAAPA